MLTTTTTSPLAAAIKRLAIPKDQKRVMTALADVPDWTPMSAMLGVLGKTGAPRVVKAVLALLEEHLVEGGERTDDTKDVFLRARPVEEWDRDEHFLLGAEIAW
jgi:hypothetical protein